MTSTHKKLLAAYTAALLVLVGTPCLLTVLFPVKSGRIAADVLAFVLNTIY